MKKIGIKLKCDKCPVPGSPLNKNPGRPGIAHDNRSVAEICVMPPVIGMVIICRDSRSGIPQHIFYVFFENFVTHMHNSSTYAGFHGAFIFTVERA